ncbi:MAG: P-loop NTPase fold protein [Pseudomonadota bacterium]
MSVATVKTVVTRFLASETAEVLALKGSWGVGKTFAWNQLVQQHKNDCKVPSYCYVSLFGVSSIAELRTAIFAKTTAVKLIGEERSAKTINAEWGRIGWETIKDWWHRFSKFKDIPYLKNLSVGLEALAPYLIRKTIICLDDFERLNTERIKPDEILGFISELKEEKECKIVLIFNEDELQSKDAYRRYREKVIDIEVLFAPTAEEAAELALPTGLAQRETIKKYAISLGIKNIRILRKIASLTRLMQDAIVTLHDGVMEQAVMTLVLLAWCYYDSDEKRPTLDFIIEWNQMVWGFNESEGKEEDPKRLAWAKVLQDYGLLHMDEFDQTIFKVIECGYLEETGFLEEAGKLDAQLRANELEQSFTEAWNLFHDTFADNQAELVQALVDSFKKSVCYISPLTLNGTTMLLRQLGQAAIADQLIDHYIESRSDEDKLFDLANHPFSGDIRDPAIRERFNKRFTEIHAALPLTDAVKHIAAKNGWSREHIEALKAANEDDFYQLFKQDHGESLGAVVKACLQFEGWEEHRKIGQMARAAIVRIGKETPLNAIRVRRYGVAIEEPKDAAPQSS